MSNKNRYKIAKSIENIQNQTLEKKHLNENENTKIAAIDSKKQPLNSPETPNELEEILKKKKEEEKEVVVLNYKKQVANVLQMLLLYI